MKVAFGSKAETLERLASRVSTGSILPQERFTVGDWQQDPNLVMDRLMALEWAQEPVIVRSSGLSEDAAHESLAGHFHSELDARGRADVADAVERVVASFGPAACGDQVFVQPMLRDVTLSGVAFTRDPRSGGHYDVINYDTGGSTESVTSGTTNDLATFYSDKTRPLPEGHPFAGLTVLLREVEGLLDCDCLDVEFALADGQWFLLQARPLILAATEALDAAAHRDTLNRVHDKIDLLNRPHPYLHGDRAVFGIMPDWNPAEIIGVRPRPLALSTYRELVTDSVWAYQRNNYGYLNLRSFPLLISLAGQPYIDVRVSFNSFIPADIHPDLAERLVNHYTDGLVRQPNFHDKVEFEILYSCYTLDLPERLQDLRIHGFSEAECGELAESLRRLTNRIVHSDGLWKADTDRLHKLQERQEIIAASGLSPIERIYWLLEDCKRYGTLPFAGLARAGFIAVQLLKSLVSTGVLRRDDYDRFMVNLETISSRLGEDLTKLSRSEFLKRYGHLRPGTYDLTCPRYDEEPERYFNPDQWAEAAEIDPADRRRAPDEPEFTLSMAQLNRLEGLLAEHRIEHGALSLFNFIKGAIEGREFAKFVFTRSLSDALQALVELGASHGFTREDMSFADIDVVRRLYGSCADTREVLERSIAEGRQAYASTLQINLPPLITAPADVFEFTMPVNEPNYITLNSVTGRVVTVADEAQDLTGNILLIPSADPGFDWIFSHKVGGFITMFGGANSHMAIRAGELGIPAVIGAGEVLFSNWSEAVLLEIDCAKQCVTVLQ